VCDTRAATTVGGTWFAKNSDRPPGERQQVLAARRAGGATVRTQYLTLADPGAWALVG
jgi:hypothetical protein